MIKNIYFVFGSLKYGGILQILFLLIYFNFHEALINIERIFFAISGRTNTFFPPEIKLIIRKYFMCSYAPCTKPFYFLKEGYSHRHCTIQFI